MPAQQSLSGPRPRRWRFLLRISLITAFLLYVFGVNTDASEIFHGVVEPELTTPEETGTPIICPRITSVADMSVPADADVFGCAATWHGRAGQFVIDLRLVELKDRRYPQIYADLNRDGSFSIEERFDFRGQRHRYWRAEARLMAPTPPGSAFPRFPAVFHIAKDDIDPRMLPKLPPDQRYVFNSVLLFATAKARIDGKMYYFRYSVWFDATEVHLPGTVQSVDTGQLLHDSLSSYRALARRAMPVFRLGSRYVSTEKVDIATRTALIRERRPDEYRRLELRSGLVIPDFSFLNADGQWKRLADFRGRHVLLYFWDRGCQPCQDELLHVRDASAHFRSERLALIGLPAYDTRPAEWRQLLVPDGPFDAHAVPWSVERLVHEWFGIMSTPIVLLLDPSGRVVSVNQQYDGRRPLRGPGLLKTLESILGR